MALLRHPSSTGKFVDDRFSALVEPNLFDANVFQPGVTFTDKYTLGAAGQIFIHKLGKVSVTVGEPGQDFSSVNTADTTIAITLNKAFRRSEKIYGATAAAVAYPIAAAHLEQALADVREGWNLEATKTLLSEKFVAATGANVGPSAVLGTAKLTAENIYGSIVNDRSVLVANKARPNVLIVSPAVYALLLQSPEFVRASDLAYETAASGQVGRVAGLNVFEYSGMPTNYDIRPGGEPAARTIEYIMYDFDAFSIVTNVEVLRIIESETFAGSLAQIEIVSGMKLTNTDRALVKFFNPAV
jgi:hypothetical protein